MSVIPIAEARVNRMEDTMDRAQVMRQYLTGKAWLEWCKAHGLEVVEAPCGGLAVKVPTVLYEEADDAWDALNPGAVPEKVAGG